MNIIDKKIDELIALAELEQDKNTQVVLLALAGSRKGGQDALLAKKMQEFVKDTLISLQKASIEKAKSSLN